MRKTRATFTLLTTGGSYLWQAPLNGFQGAEAIVMPRRDLATRSFWHSARQTPGAQHASMLPSSFKCAALAAVRLDAPLLQRPAGPELSLPFSFGALVAAIAAAAGAVTAAMLLSLVGNFLRETSSATPSSRVEDADGDRLSDVTERLVHFARLRWGTVRATMETIRLWWSGLFDEEPLTTLPEVWSPCLLEERRELEGDFMTYRLALKAGPGNVLPLALGQELTVMCLDDKNRPVRANFPLASNRRDPSGTLEIVVPAGARFNRRAAIGALTSEQQTVIKALDRLSVGGEAAVRAGRKAFDYKGSYLPITSLQCFVEELGTISILQLLQESLRRGQSTVETADVFCVSADEDDFALYDRLEDLYYKFHRKMTLSCVLDELLHKGSETASPTEPASSSSRRAPRTSPPSSVFDRNDDLRSVRPSSLYRVTTVSGCSTLATRRSCRCSWAACLRLCRE